MYDKGIFVFGSKIFPETPRDAISSLPLELSWKIFSYLDDSSLQTATRVYKVWNRIILSHRSLRKRLNGFELAMTLGSKSLAQFYKNCKMRRVKKETRKNFAAVGEYTGYNGSGYDRTNFVKLRMKSERGVTRLTIRRLGTNKKKKKNLTMKFIIIVCLFLSVALVSESKHTFQGSNTGTTLVHHKDLSYGSKAFRKRVETYSYTLPNAPTGFGRTIQGIMAVDMTGPNSEATANVTEGGIGTNFVKLRMKSERGEKLHFDLYIYA